MHAAENNRTMIRPSHDVETWIRYGDEKMFKGEFEKAVQDYDKAIVHQSDSAKAWHSKAIALEALGKYDDAIACYDTALKCDGGDAECWFNKGIALKKLGRNKEGSACVDNGINIAMGSGQPRDSFSHSFFNFSFQQHGIPGQKLIGNTGRE